MGGDVTDATDASERTKRLNEAKKVQACSTDNDNTDLLILGLKKIADGRECIL